MGLDHSLAHAAWREVVGLHAFFEDWLGGTAENTHAVFSRLESSLGEEFTMVAPSGARLQRSDVIGWLRGAHGIKGKQGRLSIAIVEPELLLLRPPLVILRYVEEQAVGSAVTRRRSTAVLEGLGDGEQGVRWLALHETWINPDH
jgi:hypothetical protein